MTEVTITRIANGWVLKTDHLEYFYSSVRDAGAAAEAIAELPSVTEECSRLTLEMKAAFKALDNLLEDRRNNRPTVSTNPLSEPVAAGTLANNTETP